MQVSIFYYQLIDNFLIELNNRWLDMVNVMTYVIINKNTNFIIYKLLIIITE
jgi:hypothetical protein